MPTTIVASRDGRIVLIDSKDGKVLRTIADRTQTGGAPADPLFVPALALTPDGKAVFFTRPRSESCLEIYRISVSGGRASFVARGYSPDVSPDGKRLAYNASDSCGERKQSVVVRDLATGKERSWYAKRYYEDGFGRVRWAPNPRYLLVQACGVHGCTPFSLDTVRTDQILDGEAFGPRDYNGVDITMLSLTVRRGGGTVVFGVDYPDVPPDATYPDLEFNPRTRQVTTIFATGGAQPLDFDESGDHFLYLAGDDELFRYNGDKPVSLGTGFTEAVW
jgi:hypothetical protein